MKKNYCLLVSLVWLGVVTPIAFSQTQEEKPKAEIAAAPEIVGSWRPLEKMEIAEGVVPELVFFADGNFRLVTQNGDQIVGKFTVENKDGEKILTLSYPEQGKTRAFRIAKLDQKNLDIENAKTKKITSHERIEQKGIKNPLLPE